MIALAVSCTLISGTSFGQSARSLDAAVQAAATAQKQPLLASLKKFIDIETGSRDHEGIAQATELLGTKLKALDGQVQFIEPLEATNYRMMYTPEKISRMVNATCTGTGSKRIMLIAHIDSVYPKGMAAKQPFRIEGDKAYGLGISDEKVDDQPEGGGTDAAFAALKTQAAVVERFGLQGFGGHSADNE